MKVLLINGSPRKGGNTHIALSEVAKTLNENGVETEIVSIGVKAMQGCIACNRCRELERCVFQDELYDRIRKQLEDGIDGLIVGSPTYYAGPNGSFIVWIIGLVMALSNIGVNIGALLGTLGIGGIAFALAAQDTVKNVFGAFTILTDKPFNIGDTIRVDNIEGTVIDVGVRSTKIMDYNKRIITFPNYKVTDASIINISSEPMRRVVLKLGLTYNTTSEKMKEALNILKAIPKRIENVSSKPSDTTAVFTEYTDSALNIMYIYFIEKQGDILMVTSNVNMEILDSFNKAGIDFAFPTRTIYVEKDELADLAKEKK